MASNKGGRKCIGINVAEMFLALAAIRYGLEHLETDLSVVGFRHDYHVA